MSRIDDLIAEHCPGGVEFRALGDVCDVFSGFAFRSSLFNDKGVGLPLIRIRDVNSGDSGTFYSGEYDERYLVSTGDLLIGMDGDFRAVRWQRGPALLNQRVCRLQELSLDIEPSYLHHLAKVVVQTIQDRTEQSTVKHLSSRDLKATKIPVPPLAVQREIAAILDQMETLKVELEAELEAELEQRSSQYAYYRDSLLNSGNSACQWRTLYEVAAEFGRGKSKHRPRNDAKLYGGPYPFIQTGDIRNSSHRVTAHSQTYSELGLAQSKLWPRGTVCITIAANIAETAVLDFDACFPDSVVGLVPDPLTTTPEYVEYLLQSFKSTLASRGQGSAQENINLATFEHARFPFPSLKEQARIVAILDRFDALVSDLSIGLPAEIEARRKQYEYYRDRLLTFEEAA
ncbi:hypothetical protein GCM10011584_19640 [Nocardioides phosphati]|uniref:Type I restriction modification DNA specificity domain-containing protein n=1 Tax=Nocardioides phosphati TaxID=1867775 RepID=A0ABQ2NCL4_9ACTN|nr:restriction endonuclease subunit S [Nocardioides phosphati]GGO89657.1 hypothetical protein GCM10011584_19640 [Nocardioides phosphati]